MAVIDTGVNVNHEEFQNRTVAGYDYTASTTTMTDTNGHGTMVAGCVAATANNDKGIAGTGGAADVQVVPFRAGVTKDLSVANVVSALEAISQRDDIRVVNMSFGAFSDFNTLKSAIAKAKQKDIVMVAAAGNNGVSTPMYPAAYEGVISVTATDSTATDSLSVDQPRIYFGEGDYPYAIVKAATPEFDYPKGDNNVENWYEGTGGIQLNGINRLALTLYTGSAEMILSSEVTGDSRILIHRNIMERIQTIAPFLEYDTDPYMVLVDGKQYWIADAFVKSDKYPYAQPYDDAGNNYIKNPVKVVVDAYNGDVTFYQVADEPILNTPTPRSSPMPLSP